MSITAEDEAFLAKIQQDHPEAVWGRDIPIGQTYVHWPQCGEPEIDEDTGCRNIFTRISEDHARCTDCGKVSRHLPQAICVPWSES